MSLLTQAEINEIVADIRDIVHDSVIASTVSYRLAGTTVTSWSPTTQVIPEMYATSSVSMFKGSYSLDEVAQSGGLIEFSDIKFISMTSDVSGTLSVKDLISESSTTWQSATTYQIISKRFDPLQVCYFLQCRSV